MSSARMHDAKLKLGLALQGMASVQLAFAGLFLVGALTESYDISSFLLAGIGSALGSSGLFLGCLSWVFLRNDFLPFRWSLIIPPGLVATVAVGLTFPLSLALMGMAGVVAGLPLALLAEAVGVVVAYHLVGLLMREGSYP